MKKLLKMIVSIEISQGRCSWTGGHFVKVEVESNLGEYWVGSMQRPEMALIARIVFALPTPVMNM